MPQPFSKHCIRCGHPLSEDMQVSACPRCMFLAALDPEEASGGECSEQPEEQMTSGGSPLEVERLGDFVLLEEIGRGGMGIVFKAQQISLDRTVAIKMLLLGPLADREIVERFRREATAAAALRHPNIIEIHEIGEHDGQLFFSMDYVDGRSLAEFITERGNRAPDFARTAEWVQQIAAAVQHAHEHGVLHRDLKPANILIDSDLRVLVTDFGLARWLDQDSSLTLTGQMLGSPSYMPPEFAAGRHRLGGAASDVYSLGAVFYELLTGRPPFLAESMQETLIRIREEQPIAPRALHSGIPRDLETICLKCLEKEPHRRYATAQALSDDLGRYLRHEPIQIRPVGPLGKTWRWCGRKPALAGTMALALIIFLVGLAGVVSQWQRAELTAEREAMERARAEDSLRRLEMQRVEELLQDGRAAEGVAWLAFLLRQDPSDEVVGQRLLSELTYRNWPLPATEPLAHEDEVHYAEFSPDGQKILTASLDNAVRLWDATTGHLLVPPLRHSIDPVKLYRSDFLGGQKPLFACFSPDSERVATASVDNSARLWDATTGTPISPPLIHDDWVTFVAFSPDGSLFATASKDATVRLWDGRTGELSGAPLQHSDWVNFAEFSPDGTRLFTGADDGVAQVWDLQTRRPIGQTLTHGDWVKAGKFTPDGSRIATASSDGTARIWDAATGKPLSPPLQHRGTVVTLSFSPDGSRLATASFDQTVRLWNGFNGSPIGVPLVHADTVRSVQFSPEGRRLLTASEDGQVRVWDLPTGDLLTQPFRHRNAVWSARFSPEGWYAVSASSDRTVQVLDVRPGAAFRRDLRGIYAVRDLRWTPEDRQVVLSSYHCITCDPNSGQILGFLKSGGGSRYPTYSPDGNQLLVTSGWRSYVWDANDWKILFVLQHQGGINAAHFSQDGTEILTGSDDGSACLWNATTGSRRLVIRCGKPVSMAEFSPDNNRVLLVFEGAVRVCQRDDGRSAVEWETHQGPLSTAQFSPDGARVLTASTDGTVRVWEAANGELVSPSLRHGGQVYQAWFSPDGSRVLTASEDGTARLWDSQTGLPIGSSLQHESAVLAATFSPDGEAVATASRDLSVRFWNGRTGQPQSSPLRHPAAVNNVTFNQDGTRLAASVNVRIARIWKVVDFEIPSPEWLPVLAETTVGLQISEQREVLPVDNARLVRLRQEALGRPPRDPHAPWLKWFLTDRSRRNPGPEAFIPDHTAEQLPRVESKVGAPFMLSRFDEPMTLWPQDGRFRALAALDLLRAYRMRNEDRWLHEVAWLTRSALELTHDDETVYRARAEYLTEIGDLTRANRILEEGSSVARTPLYWLLWGEVLESLGRDGEAVKVYTSTLDLVTQESAFTVGDKCEALLKRAKIYTKRGRLEDAKADRRAAFGITVASRDLSTPESCIDLSEFYNANLDADWRRGTFNTHNLRMLPRGCQTLDGVDYDIRGAVQLADPWGGPWRLRYPAAVTGIPIQRHCRVIHFLHAMDIPLGAGDVAGNYVVHLENGNRHAVPLRSEYEIGAWDHPSATAEATVVWQGMTAAGIPVQLFHHPWTNPEPAVAVVTVDFITTPRELAPFLVAISVEAPERGGIAP